MTTALPSSDAAFGADASEHQSIEPAPTAAERRGLTYALIAAALLHILIPLAILLYYAVWPPRPAPTEQEIPVEVVVEQPPPKPDEPAEKPKPPPEPEDERPAYDAPRAATPEKADRESPDEKTQSPIAKAETPTKLGAPAESQSPEAAQEQKAEAPPREETQQSPDAEQTASPTPSPSESEAAPPAPKVEAKPAPPPAPKSAEAPLGAPLPSAEELPAYKFAAAATQSPIVGGNADTRYFTIVYGMIRARLIAPSGPHAQYPTRGGAVVFTVDEGGNLVERKLISSSGSQSLDLAVMNAIAAASPYPAPPGWQPRSMRLVYGK